MHDSTCRETAIREISAETIGIADSLHKERVQGEYVFRGIFIIAAAFTGLTIWLTGLETGLIVAAIFLAALGNLAATEAPSARKEQELRFISQYLYLLARIEREKELSDRIR